MYEEIIKKLKQQLPNEKLDEIKKHNIHLGVFAEPYLTYILEGKKTIESSLVKIRYYLGTKYLKKTLLL